jgi:hypothetical protein
MFVSMVARISLNSKSAASANCSNAFVSFGKHDPPQPGPGDKYSRPIRRS